MIQKQPDHKDLTPQIILGINKNLSQKISDSFNSNISTFLLLTPSLNLYDILAYQITNKYIISFQRTQIPTPHQLNIFINFQDYQTYQINLSLAEIKKNLLLKKTFTTIPKLEIVKLNSITKQKRNHMYVAGGNYSVSSIIFLLDLLSKTQIHPTIISTVFIKDIEHIKNYKHILAWIINLIKKQNKNISVVSISQNVQILHKDRFLTLYRMFGIEKITLWPYGRSEILNFIKNTKKKFKQFEHVLPLSNFQVRLHQILQSLMKYASERILVPQGCQKSYYYNMFMRQKNEYFRDKQVFQASYSQKGSVQFINLFQIRSLMFKLQNYTPIQTYLYYQQCTKTSNLQQIWMGANQKIDAQIQQFSRILKKQIFEFKIRQNPRQIKLLPLFQNSLKNNNIVITTGYQLKFLYPKSRKIQSLIKIFESLQKRQLFQNSNQSQAKFEQQQQKQSQSQQQQQNKRIKVWISVNNDKLKKHLAEQIYELIQTHNGQKRTAFKCIIKLKSIFKMLTQTRENRQIKYKHLSSKKSKSINDIIQLNQNILLQQFYEQLKLFFTLHHQFQAKFNPENTNLNEQIAQKWQLHINKLQSLYFKYIDSQFKDQKFQNFVNYDQIQEIDLIWKNKIDIQINCHTQIPILNAFLRQNKPQIIILYNPNLTLLRFLYLYQAQITQSTLSESQKNKLLIKQIHILNAKGSIEENVYLNGCVRQDKNFWQISKLRVNMPKFEDDAGSRVKIIKQEINTINTREGKGINLLKNVDIKKLELFNFQCLDNFGTKKNYIIIDKRQFKSPLPSALYHFGFQIVPVFLQNADYILSNQIGIQRKAVQTQDIHQSLRSGRLDQQLRRLAAKFKHPYLLVEFSQNIPFSNVRLKTSYNHIKNQNYQINIRRSLMMLLKKYRSVRVIWSRNSDQTAQIFLSLKRGRPQPDIQLFQQKQQKIDQQSKQVQQIILVNIKQKKAGDIEQDASLMNAF